MARRVAALFLGLSLTATAACDDLLEVDLEHLLTEEAIAGPGSAETQVNSAIALFECGTSEFGWVALGHEDVFESIAGVANTAHVWRAEAVTGTCDATSQSQAWFDQIMGARALIVGTDLTTLEPNGVYTRLVNEWDQSLVPNREELMAISAIYMAASLSHFGQFFCEGALDLGPVLGPSDFLNMAEDWVDSALIHTGANDFAMPNGIAPSAELMAVALRAQIRWANGDLQGARDDALAVLAADPTFTAFVSREAGEQRRNKIFHAGSSAGFSGMLGVIDWWNPAARAPNPATGLQWTDPIPFTGYIFLGVLPDGRTLEAGNVPVRWAEEQRDQNEAPIPLANGAVPDTRVEHIYKSIQGPGKREVPAKYSSDADPIPLVSWRELTLYVAQWENEVNNNQANAIAQVNTLRTFHQLPTVSGAYLASLTDGTNDAQEVRALILEEARRELYSEAGRYWSWKIQNTDMLWFPRRQGTTPFQGYTIQGGVRLAFPESEYTLNPNFTNGLADRGTGCPADEAPVF